MKKKFILTIIFLYSISPGLFAKASKDNVKKEEAGAPVASASAGVKENSSKVSEEVAKSSQDKAGASVASDSTYLLDKIEAVAHAQEGTDIVTLSDVNRPSLGGGLRSRDDIVFEKLVFMDAKKYKIMPGDEEVDKYLAVVQRENNLSRDDLKAIFEQAGYTFEEGREEFRRMQAVNSMFDFKVRQNMIVPRRAIEAYYNEHPEKQEAAYYLERAVVLFNPNMDKAEQRKKIERVAKTHIGIADIRWPGPNWFNRSEISEDKAFIFTMQQGDVSMPQEVADGFELYRLKDKREERVLTLDERYDEIAEILRQPKLQALMQDYKDTLLNTASLVYFD